MGTQAGLRLIPDCGILYDIKWPGARSRHRPGTWALVHLGRQDTRSTEQTWQILNGRRLSAPVRSLAEIC